MAREKKIKPAVRDSITTQMTETRVLSVSPAAEDHRELSRILTNRLWQISVASNYRQAMAHLRSRQFALVVCESDLEGKSWKNMLRHLEKSLSAPMLIVTSRTADDHLWAEVLNLGGYDVLAKPFDEQEVRRVLENARTRSLPVGVMAAGA